MACFSLSLYFRRRLFSLTSLLTITFLDWVNNFHPAFFLDDKLILSIYCWAAGSQQTCPVGSQWPTHWWSHYQNRALIWAPQSQMVPIVGWQTLSREGPDLPNCQITKQPWTGFHWHFKRPGSDIIFFFFSFFLTIITRIVCARTQFWLLLLNSIQCTNSNTIE